MSLLLHLILSVFGGFGIAVALVEKRRQWPVRRYNILLKKLLGKIHRRAPNMLNCTVCTSFWATLFVELGIAAAWSIPTNDFEFHWLWPLSGFMTVGLTWTLIQFMTAIDTHK